MRDLVLSHRSLVSLLVGLSAAAVVASAGGSPAAHPTQVLTRGAVEAIAVDGNVVAYDAAARPGGCNTVHTWNTATGVDVVVSGAGTCAADSTSTGAGVRELALAGSRVAWIVNLGGNTESSDTLYTAPVGVRGERTAARALRTGSVDGQLDGAWLGHLAADDDLIALNRWTTAGGSVVAASLRVVEGGLQRIREGPSALAVASVAAGRIALSSTGSPVTVLDRGGAVVTTFLPTDEARAVALTERHAVVLGAGRLELRRLVAGAPRARTIPIPGGARNLDAHGELATIVVARRVLAVELTTGRVATIATAPKAIVDARIDRAGLVYAFNRATGVNGSGTIALVPLALVRAKLA